jgi:Cu/Ag efflux protein CusF
MRRFSACILFSIFLFADALLAQDDIQRGKIKALDRGRKTITINTGGKDLEFRLTARTRVVGASNPEDADALNAAGIKEGAEVMFKADIEDGRPVLVGLKAGGRSEPDRLRARVKKIDLERQRLTLTVAGKDQEFRVTEKTLLFGSEGDTIKERLRNIKAGAEVVFKAQQRDGEAILLGLKPAAAGPAVRTQPPVDTSKLRPLPELGAGDYHGFKGGLYPDGKNDRPVVHEAAGLALARQVQCRDTDGKPSADGKIVILSVGMSNTGQASQGFSSALAGNNERNPRVVFVNGAVGAMTAASIQDPADQGSGTRYWTTVDERLRKAGITRVQVQIVWIKEADAGPKEGFPGYARKLQAELTRIVQVILQRFPNVKLCYLSSRTYGGYARTPLNPEPYAYESGFAVQWLIGQQIQGDPTLTYKEDARRAPWLSWGPYLWANGSVKRADGFHYDPEDFVGDGTHLSASGQQKVGRLLLQFFLTDTTTRPWFVRASSGT